MVGVCKSLRRVRKISDYSFFVRLPPLVKSGIRVLRRTQCFPHIHTHIHTYTHSDTYIYIPPISSCDDITFSVSCPSGFIYQVLSQDG